MSLRVRIALDWVLLVVPACLSAQQGAHEPVLVSQKTSYDQAITHVTVIDPRSGGVEHHDWTLVLRGNKIVFCGSSKSARVPSGATIHNETGRYVIPGLWDSHVHLSQAGASAFPLLLQNGVTGVRDMGSVLAEIRTWQAEKRAGALIPRIITPGPKLDVVPPERKQQAIRLPDNVILTTPEEAKAEVDLLKKEGVDFIKVHNGMTPKIYAAVAQESKAVGLPFAGHLPVAGALAAAEAGQRTIEHGVSYGSVGMLMCSAATWHQIETDPAARACERYCAPLPMQPLIFPAMVRAHVWFTPTLVSFRGHLVGTPELPDWKAISGSTEVYPALLKHWHDPLFSNEELPTPFEQQLIHQLSGLAAAGSNAGVHLLAGSDLGDPYVIPGFALHDELELMVKAGVPTLTALQSATSEPAEAFGLSDQVGSVTAGHTADLVVLDADPLISIANARKIHAVLVEGRWIILDTRQP